jgi:hypothetical protein
MPATLSSIRGKIVEIRICLDPDKPEDERTPDDYFTLFYRSHNINAKIERLAIEAQKDGRQFQSLVEMCLPVFDRWDLKFGPSEEQTAELDRLADEIGKAAPGSTARQLAEQAYREYKADVDADVAAQSSIPITREGLSDIPASVLMLILSQIGESRSPNLPTA